jgi:hypothetical protein
MATALPDVRLDPDAHKGVVVEKRPERMLGDRAWVFWPAMAICTLMAIAPLVVHSLMWPDMTTGDAQIDNLGRDIFNQLSAGRMWQTGLWLLVIASILIQRVAIRWDWPLLKVQLASIATITLCASLGLFLSPIAGFVGYTGVELLPAALLGGSAFAITMFVDPRNGRTYLRCRKCEYEFVPGASAPHNCPECGHLWLKKRGLARVRERKRRPLVMMSALMLFGLAVGAAYAAPLVHKALPTSLLVRHAAGDWWQLRQDTWDRLDPVNLSDRQVHRIFISMLDRAHAGKLSFDDDAQAWILAAVTSGRIPPDLQEELFHGSWTYEVRPRQTSTRAPTQVGLHLYETWSVLASLWKVHVVPEGLFINGEEIIRDPAALTYHNSIILSGEADYYGSYDVPNPKSWTVHIDTPGKHEITAAYWLVVLPVPPLIANVPATPQVTWDADGKLVAPPEALFVKRYTVEGDLIVNP